MYICCVLNGVTLQRAELTDIYERLTERFIVSSRNRVRSLRTSLYKLFANISNKCAWLWEIIWKFAASTAQFHKLISPHFHSWYCYVRYALLATMTAGISRSAQKICVDTAYISGCASGTTLTVPFAEIPNCEHQIIINNRHNCTFRPPCCWHSL
jgi:hypothetical protein